MTVSCFETLEPHRFSFPKAVWFSFPVVTHTLIESVERKNSYGSAAATPTPRSNAPLKGFPMPARQPAARCGPGRFRAWGEHQRH